MGIMNAPATPELLARIAALPEAKNQPTIAQSALHNDEKFSLLGLLRHVRGLFAVVILLLAIIAVADLAFPLLVRHAIDAGIVAGNYNALWFAATAGLITVVVSWLGVATNTVMTARTGERLLYALRIRSYRHLQSLGINYFEANRSGAIMTRMTTDIDALSSFLQTGLAQGAISAFTLIGVIVVLVATQASLALVALATLPVLVTATYFFRRVSSALYKRAGSSSHWSMRISKRLLAASGRFACTIAVPIIIKHLPTNRTATVAFAFAPKWLWRYSSPAINFLSEVATAAVLAVGATQVAAGTTSPGVLVAFTLYLGMLLALCSNCLKFLTAINRPRWGSTVSTTYWQLTLCPIGGSASGRPSMPPELRLDHTSFAYPVADAAAERKPVLDELNLTIAPGETVAIVGATGAGKSTIVKLFARFYDPTSGAVRPAMWTSENSHCRSGAERSAMCRRRRTCSPAL